MVNNHFQQGVVDHITTHPSRKALFLCVRTGRGKTLASVLAAHAWGYTDQDVLVASPNRMTASIYGKVQQDNLAPVGHDPTRYGFSSFQKIGRMEQLGHPLASRKLLIIDEVHHLRGMGVRFQAVLRLAREAERVVAMTATPMVNGPQDLCCIINLLNHPPDAVDVPLEYFRVQCDAARKDPQLYDQFRPYFSSPRVSTIFLPNVPAHAPHHPTRTDYVASVTHDRVQQTARDTILHGTHPGVWDTLYATLPAPRPTSHGNIFLNRTRQISNMAHLRFSRDEWVCGGPGPVDSCGTRNSVRDDPVCTRCQTSRRKGVRRGLPGKLAHILAHLEHGKSDAAGGPRRFRAIIVSSWVKNGAERVQHLLDRKTGASRLRVDCIVGKTWDRAARIRRFNRENGPGRRTDVLCISAAASESIEFKDTHQVHLMDQHWNTALHEQAIGRAVRLKSHERPPGDPRGHVKVFQWYTRSRGVDPAWSTEEWLRIQSGWKQRAIRVVEARVLLWAAQQTQDPRLHQARIPLAAPVAPVIRSVRQRLQHHGPECACMRAV